ncbi:MAG: single-stranded-DNA-specific exonuclease RecJ [Patescibacteria group bacterium]
MKKKWQLAPKIEQSLISVFPELNPLILQLLFNRGLVKQKSIDEFLLPDYSQDIHNPFLFSDMEKLIERVLSAKEKQEKVFIYGDYDADGITASAVLWNLFKKIGLQNVEVYIPDRDKEGYGLNENSVRFIKESGANLIVTCDCGITNLSQIDLAKDLGMDVIVTDHHLPKDKLPNVLAIINPHCEDNYPFKNLAGVGVAFKVAQAFAQRLKDQTENNWEAFEKWLLDLVAIGTVADSMALKGENRALVKYGLIVLNKTSRVGLMALIKSAGLNLGAIETTDIEFCLSPRLNAVGRLQHAKTALDLILTDDPNKAEMIAAELNQINIKRQKLVEEIYQEIIQNQIPGQLQEKIIISIGENWPVGLIGLIASKLQEAYQRPALVMTARDKGISGSGRSNEHFNLVENLKFLEHYFIRFGGHAGACGFELKNKEEVNDFIAQARVLANQKLAQADFTDNIFIDAEVCLSDITWEIYEDIQKFAPFGRDNKYPLFLINNLEIGGLQWMGKQNNHLRIISKEGKRFIFFKGLANGGKDLRVGDKVNIIFQLSVNQWNGSQELQMKVVDFSFKE